MVPRTAGTVLATVLLVAGCSGKDAGTAGGTAGATATDDLLVTNWGSSEVSAFHLDATGAITGDARVTKVAKGTEGPQGSVRSPDGRWLYVANWGSSNVTGYRVGPNGQLENPVTVEAKPAASGAYSLALSRDGRHLYLASETNGKDATVSHFPIGSDGSPQEGTTVASNGTGTTAVAVTPDGRTLLAASPGSGTLSTFRLAADGTPTDADRAASGDGTFFVAVADRGRLVVATNENEDTVSLFRLGADSKLTLVTKVPSGGRQPRGIVVDPTGTRAYVANFNDGTGPGAVTGFTITPTGLTPLMTATPTGSAGSEGIALSPDGTSLYVANYNDGGPGSIASYRIDAQGQLGPLRGPVETGGKNPDLASITVAKR
jgi:6-phosphogluconolactonase (cycloisomerase 2 family)